MAARWQPGPNTRALERQVHAAHRRVLTVLAEALTGDVGRAMASSPRSGDTARRLRAVGVRRRAQGLPLRARDIITHRRSAPGEPPAVDTGAYLASLGYLLREGPAGPVALVGSGLAKIPAALEFGRRDGQLAARPHWRPAVARLRARAGAIVRQARI